MKVEVDKIIQVLILRHTVPLLLVPPPLSLKLTRLAYVYLFIYLGFYVAFNTVQVISKVKVGVLRPIQPGPYWDWSSELPLVGLEGQSWGFTSRSTARVILGQVLRIATCGTRTHRGDSL